MKLIYTVYVLQSEVTGRYYKGMTSDILRRLGEHNRGKTVSTRNGILWKLAYSEEYSTLEAARSREKYFKTAAGLA